MCVGDRKCAIIVCYCLIIVLFDFATCVSVLSSSSPAAEGVRVGEQVRNPIICCSCLFTPVRLGGCRFVMYLFTIF